MLSSRNQSAWWLGGAALAAGLGVSLARMALRKRAVIDMPALRGWVAVVTGANTGIGKKVAEGLARQGAKVVLACRSAERGAAAAADITRVTGVHEEMLVVREVDLADLSSVRRFVAAHTGAEKHTHLLVNNAGVMVSTRESSAQGFERTMATNYVGPFLLTQLLLGSLKASAQDGFVPRVVNVGSRLERRGSLEPVADVLTLPGEYSLMRAYGESKCALLSHSLELARRERGVLVLNVTPGMVKTSLSRFVAPWILALTAPLQWLLLKSPQEGANAVLRAATATADEVASGSYVGDELRPVDGVSAAARDEQLAGRLWDVTEAAVRGHAKRE